MTIALAHPMETSTISPGTIIDALRCWTEQRVIGKAVQPRLFAILSRTGHGLLAPVFDSLFLLFAAGLRRPLDHGDKAALSTDETLLLGLLSGAMRRRECLDCEAGVGSALDCALCSTRIMLALGGVRQVTPAQALALP